MLFSVVGSYPWFHTTFIYHVIFFSFIFVKKFLFGCTTCHMGWGCKRLCVLQFVYFSFFITGLKSHPFGLFFSLSPSFQRPFLSSFGSLFPPKWCLSRLSSPFMLPSVFSSLWWPQFTKTQQSFIPQVDILSSKGFKSVFDPILTSFFSLLCSLPWAGAQSVTHSSTGIRY